MIRQTALPFKLEKRNDLITLRAGPSLSNKFTMGTDLLNRPDRHPPELVARVRAA